MKYTKGGMFLLDRFDYTDNGETTFENIKFISTKFHNFMGGIFYL
jgi:hypothetical protein